MKAATVGKEVDVFFDHTDEKLSGIVVEHVRRYGKQNGGRDYINPLLKVRKPDGSVQSLDSSFVTAVRTPKPFVDYSAKSYQYYRSASDNPYENPMRNLVQKKKGKLIAFDPMHLIQYAMFYIRVPERSTSSVAVLDLEYLVRLADVRGLFQTLPPSNLFASPKFSVRKKVILNWIRRNFNRAIEPKRSVDARTTIYHMENEADLDAMMMQDLEDDLLAEEMALEKDMEREPDE